MKYNFSSEKVTNNVANADLGPEKLLKTENQEEQFLSYFSFLFLYN
jgi:hypothetical protein